MSPRRRLAPKALPRLLALLLLFVALAPTGALAAEEEGGDRVELNTATVDQLCTLPGIGPKKAEAIIAQREHKRFTRVTQLLLVRGIGMKTLRRLRTLVYVAPPPAPRVPAPLPPEVEAPAPPSLGAPAEG